ncbi:putative bifunctional diguanylate cyclase/phosphodiesterase [Pengzhenrongella frigida]|uniref:putative bifunctional diguanylate cyclase/phosphodiesterase n=1 Tax=Pengzhenrongella frigida TaxID=1259133 RepID=UPI0013EDC97D|nr:diguanylate cyclase [Cellulomonas sp. HLT2-17]
MDGAAALPAHDATSRVGRLETIFELAPVGIGIVDLEGRTTMTNDLLRRSLGFTADEFAAMTFTEFTHPDDAAANLELFEQMVDGELDQFSMDKRFIGKDGQMVWAELTVSLVRNRAGAPDYAIGMTQDITARKRLERELRTAEEGYRLLVERVPAVVYAAEPGAAGRWDYVSPQIAGMLGFTADEWLAEPDLWNRQLDPRDRAAVLDHERRVIRSGSTNESTDTYRLRHRNGTTVWVRDDAMLLWDAEGRAVFHGVLVDVTREKQLEERLAHEVLHDSLTGLPNRKLFRDRVGHALTAAARSGEAVAVLFIDLDGFKTINDTFGHAAGDEVIVAAARRLQTCARAGDTAARLGGDEFAVLVENLTPAQAMALGDRILAVLRDTPVEFGGRTATVGASIGIAVAGAGETTETLLRNADLAMYQAKAEGRGRLALYTPGMHDEVVNRFRLESSLHAVAVATAAISLDYQPIADLGSGVVVGIEATVRWSDPAFGELPRNELIAAAEHSGVLAGVGSEMFRRACTAFVAWRSAVGQDAYLSFAVSPQQVEHALFATAVRGIIDDHGLEPAGLVIGVADGLELAEGGLGALDDLRAMGVRIAIEGFGTARSSLDCLRRLPADMVKIDGSFLEQGASHDPALLRAIVQLVRSLDLVAIGDGVETLDQLAELRAASCDLGRGPLFGVGAIELIPATIPVLRTTGATGRT